MSMLMMQKIMVDNYDVHDNFDGDVGYACNNTILLLKLLFYYYYYYY